MRFDVVHIFALMAALALVAGCAGATGSTESHSAARGDAGAESQDQQGLGLMPGAELSDGTREALGSSGYSDDAADAEPAEEENEPEAQESAAGSAEPSIGMMTPSTEATPSGAELIPEGWPEYIPIMSGFTVRFGGSDEHGMRVGATGTAPLAEVRDYYLGLPDWRLGTERVQEGESVDTNSEGAKGVLLIITRGEESLTINIFENDGRTSFQLFYVKE